MKSTTFSLAAAAFVVAQGQPLPELEEVSGKFQFLFNDSNGQVKQLFNAYFHGGQIAARDFYAALCDVRAAMNRAKGGVR